MKITNENDEKIINILAETAIQLKRTIKFLDDNRKDYEHKYREKTNGKEPNEELKKYMDLPYNILIRKIAGSVYYYESQLLEFKNCTGTGRTYDEAYEEALYLLEREIKHHLKNNIPIPMPIEQSK